MIVREFDELDYQLVYNAMQGFTEQRGAQQEDEFWLLSHHPVFTQGQAGKAEHLLATGDIPVVQADRGGQVTYHGPGQIVGYVLFDLKRADFGVRQLVSAIEQAIVTVLASYGVESAPRPDAPGVYVGSAKIAQLGLRVRKGRSYHGLSLNVDMDMEPFLRINPCGYQGMEVICLKQLLGENTPSLAMIKRDLSEALARELQLQVSHWHDLRGQMPQVEQYV